MAKDSENSGEITVGQAAKLFNVSERYIQLRVNEGHINRSGRGNYQLVSVCRGVKSYMEQLLENAQKSAGLTRMQNSKARVLDLQLAEKERKLIAVSEAMEVIDALSAKVRTELSGLASRATRDIGTRRSIEKETNAALNRIATEMLKQSKNLQGGGDAFEIDNGDE